MKHILILLSLVLVSATLSACTKVGATVAAAPGYFDDVRLYDNKKFDARTGLTLDIYSKDSTINKPVIVFFHGGRWQHGNKELYRFIGDAFAKHGYVVVIPDYRKYPEVKFPAFEEDGAKAVAWVHQYIARFGGNPDKIILMGHSAGAHTAALLTADEHYLQDAGVDPSAIKGMIGLAGPYAFTPDEPDLKEIFGPPANYQAMNVTNFISGTEPPMFLLYGLKDRDVEPYNLERLQARIKEQGGAVKVATYSHLDHRGIAKALTWVYEGQSTVTTDILTFIQQVTASN